MTEAKDEDLATNIESLAFVDRAIRMDKDRFLELSRLVSELIEALQSSGANPVTIYYLTRALNDYASDKLDSFGRVVEQNRDPNTNISTEGIRKACEQLFALALEDAAKMTPAEQQKLIEEQTELQKRKPNSLAGYA